MEVKTILRLRLQITANYWLRYEQKLRRNNFHLTELRKEKCSWTLPSLKWSRPRRPLGSSVLSHGPWTEAAGSSAVLVHIYQTTRRHIPVGRNLKTNPKIGMQFDYTCNKYSHLLHFCRVPNQMLQKLASYFATSACPSIRSFDHVYNSKTAGQIFAKFDIWEFY
jgi:hypothetical protein